MDFTYSWWYIFIVMFIVMPINGGVIYSGKALLGVILILMQIPWFMLLLNKYNITG